MKNASGKILYIGKAGNLKRRVSSYFQKAGDSRIEKLLNQVSKINYRRTDTAIEALILESKLIKKYEPPFNVKEKDDKSFLFVEITKEKFPRVLLVRGKEAQSPAVLFAEPPGRKPLRPTTELYGPFPSASNIREAMRILRRIFPYSVHCLETNKKKQRVKRRANAPFSFNMSHGSRPCFDYQIGLCPGTCIGAISRRDYLKNIKNIKLFLQGRKKWILTNLQKEMKNASKNLEFEKAAKIRRQLFALKHIQDVALLSDTEIPDSRFPDSRYRIEGYDISNISGASAVGSMAVFINNNPAKDEYRKFKIRTVTQADDLGMLREILKRRGSHTEWPLPDLILVDGGKAQVKAAKTTLGEFGFKIPVIGIAKGANRKKNEIIGKIPKGISKKTLIKVRDEAHRFAIQYHKKLRRRSIAAG